MKQRVPPGCRDKKEKPAFGKAGGVDNSWNKKALRGKKTKASKKERKVLAGVEKRMSQTCLTYRPVAVSVASANERPVGSK